MAAPISRRKFLIGSAVAGAAASVGLPSLALADPETKSAAPAAPAIDEATAPLVQIGANEYWTGPCDAAQKAIADIIPQGDRYLFMTLAPQLYQTLVSHWSLPGPDHVIAYHGSSPPLTNVMLANTSPEKPLITADPTFELGWESAATTGAKVIKIPARKDDSHDVEAMCKKAHEVNAGVIYICNPNNPTGAITARKDIEYALANKPADTLIVVDEAYIDFSDNAQTVIDLAVAHPDLLVLRTMSKLYGMAGIRFGYAIAQPLQLKKLKYFGVNSLAVTSMAAAIASLNDKDVIPTRRALNTKTREETVAFLHKLGYKTTNSESNCFLVDVKRPAKDFQNDMSTHGVMVGRSWPGFENQSRITIGSPDEMARFRDAFAQVAKGKLGPLPPPPPFKLGMMERGLIELGSHALRMA
ncbi:MAG: pyridoxal phosphate-dependent aminotransferase [Myxococcales bacterium]